MAGNRPTKGLNKFTVQEATNKLSQRKLSRIIPTIPKADYAAGDVLFNSVEIPNAVLNPGGTSLLNTCTVINRADQDWDLDLYFMQVATDFGTVDGAIDISLSELEACKFLGFIHIDANISSRNLINARVSQALLASNILNPMNPITLEAAAGSTSVYMAGVARMTSDTSGGGADVADPYEIILGIDY